MARHHQPFDQATALIPQWPTSEESEAVVSDAEGVLRKLPPHMVHAFLLHAILGYEISSVDPKARTVVRILGRSDRTVRRWINLTRKQLADETATLT